MEKVSRETWEQMQTLFHLCVDANEQEVGSVLQRATPDPQLRLQVGLLVHATRSQSTQESPAAVEAGDGARFPGYRVVRHLGSGGTGSVFLVERRVGASVQQAALKVFPGYDSESFFRRGFAREEFVLATLVHPCIPRLLDAGVSTSGDPFLVMEFAEGEPLDVFSDRRQLTVDARIRLMLRVCDAAAYAHRNLIVHLDLKPSNLLAADGEPGVWLLDFGTSKLLDASMTVSLARMVTPAYAAPEQLRNEPPSTSCDIYSLGAILFELLAGRPAFAPASFAAMVERGLKERPPEPLGDAVTPTAASNRATTPAALQKVLRGELSTVVAKCLAPAAEDRYISVDALADDLRRYLDGLPLRAKPQTRVYRMRKFLQRRRSAVLVAVGTVLLVLSGVGYGVWHQQRELVAAHRAVQMQQFMTRLFELSHSGANGKPAATVADMLRIGAETMPSFITDPADLRVGRLNIAESMAADDDYKDALPLLEQVSRDARAAEDWTSLAYAEVMEGEAKLQSSQPQEGNRLLSDAFLVIRDHTVPQVLRTRVVAWYVYGRDEVGTVPPAEVGLLRHEIQLSERKGDPASDTASAWNMLALTVQKQGGLDEAEAAYHRALTLYANVPYSNCDQGDTRKFLANLKKQRLQDEDALAEFRRSYELERSCAGEGALRTLSARSWVGNMLAQEHRYTETIALLEPAMPMYYSAVGHDSASLRLPLDALSRSYTATGRYPEAEAAAREQMRVLQGKVAPRSSPISVAYSDLGDALLHDKRYREAATALQSAADSYPMANPPTPLNLKYMDRIHGMLADAKSHEAAGSR